MTSDYLDRKWLEEGKWVGGRWSLLLVEDSHLPQIKIKCGEQLDSAVVSASLSVVLLTLFFSVDGDNLFFTVCLCLRHLTPVLMKGMVKSTAVCLMEVTDMSITAMSAF